MRQFHLLLPPVRLAFAVNIEIFLLKDSQKSQSDFQCSETTSQMLIAVILFLMRQPFISCISIYSSCHMLVIQFNAFGRKWLHVSILFYCILIDTKDSIKNGETLPIWFGCTENGRRVVFARSRSYLSHSGYRHRRRATMPTHKIYFTSNYVLHFCPRFLN